MCRIAGIASLASQDPSLERKVTLMCDLQQHGGPDDSGIYTAPGSRLVLGHRRLSLIDLSAAGHQPMIYSDRYVITFNGEIYNYPELKQELACAGLEFRTGSDTEVILAAYSRWGTQSFARLRGMFAFALYDQQEQDLVLVRDPSGIKPLYYSRDTTSVAFASEIRAFSATGLAMENRNWPVYQMAYGHIPEPVTTLENVHPLHKGWFYKINLVSGKSTGQSFSHYSYSNVIPDEQSAIESVRAALNVAVKRHLLSDAPIGVFLSGGIDSGVVTSVASKFQKEHLKTLSLYFRESDFSEKQYQDLMIQKVQCKSYQHLLTEQEFHASFPGILQAMDMPTCDGINTWFISKYAREHQLKAVLSGVGGDELFGGYPSFSRMRIALQLQQAPDLALRLAEKSSTKKINRASYLTLEGIKGLYLFLRGQYIPLQIAQQLGASEREVWNVLGETPVMPVVNSLKPQNRASWMELNMYMQNQLLRDADVMSMSHGVEIRVPFLDEEVIRSGLAIKASVKYRGPLKKQLLIDAFRDSLPEPIWNREKMGFTFPFMRWMAGSSFVKDTMLGGSLMMRRSYDKFLRKELHWSHLMSLLILQVRGAG